MIPDGYPSGIVGKSTGYHEKKWYWKYGAIFSLFPMIPDGYPSGIIGKSTEYHEKKMKLKI